MQIYNNTCNLLHRRLVEVLEHFPESPQLEQSLAMEVDKKERNELFERYVLGVYWCMYLVARLAW